MLKNYYLERLRVEAIAATKLASDRRRIVDAIDVDSLTALRRKVEEQDPGTTYTKYLNYEKYIPVSLRRAYALGLHTDSPLKILDIGTGAGYFPLVCAGFGHQVHSMDVDHYPLFNETIDILGVDRTVAAVSPFESLPTLPQKYDLVTAYRAVFKHQYEENGEEWCWREKEWEFFFQDLVTNVLTAKGRIFLDLNPEPDGSHYSPELRRYFERHGAIINKSKVYFESVDAFR